MRSVPVVLMALMATSLQADEPAADFASVPGSEFRSALRYQDVDAGTKVAPFLLMRHPVTNADYLRFVRSHPEWRRGQTPVVLAEPRYLSHWGGPLELGSATPDQPVTWVSWFAWPLVRR